jgi:hypothetical protein
VHLTRTDGTSFPFRSQQNATSRHLSMNTSASNLHIIRSLALSY